MKELQFSIEINATKERVWATFWDEKTFRDRAGIIGKNLRTDRRVTAHKVLPFTKNHD
jgi:hypothetical protein